ncbi:MAG: hypothetical protein JW849_08825 [Phycisphaerae bacterium]|nr:hypothetical protein [Phycisphaerae bacterium]
MGGCRAHPTSLAMMIGGDIINDVEVEQRQDELLGKDEAAANRMFGRRLETLIDLDRPNVKIIFYPSKADPLKNRRYIVELEDGIVVVLSKTKKNIDGVEDYLHDMNLERKLIGKTPEECSRAGDLGPPLRTFRSVEKDQLLRIYDIRHWTDFLGARYCLLRFDHDDFCRDVILMGVSATTRKDPIRRKNRK